MLVLDHTWKQHLLEQVPPIWKEWAFIRKWFSVNWGWCVSPSIQQKHAISRGLANISYTS